jgi:hypothetical protein
VHDELTRLARNIIGAIADQPKRLIIAIALGLTLKAISQVGFGSSNNIVLTLIANLDTYYFIAFAFLFVFIFESTAWLFNRQDRELAAIEREIALLSKAIGNSNLNPDTQRMIWRTVTRRLANRITRDRDVGPTVSPAPDA